jgi:glyoxylase-like metal-dependent hydrolase (beta-lactamase superfamily II)
VALAVAALLAGFAGTGVTTAAEAPEGLRPWHIQGNVWLVGGETGGTNVTVMVGQDGAMVVDTGVEAEAAQVVDVVNRLGNRQQRLDPRQKVIQTIINTSGAADHIGGNGVVREGGGVLMAGNAAFDQNFNPGAGVWAHQNVATAMLAPGADGKPAVAQKYWPTQNRTEDLYSLTYNGEPVQVIHPRNATSDGDLMVLFRTSNVLVAGNVLDMNSYPLIDTKRGGTIDGELVALNRILELAVPAEFEEGGTIVVPGHGHLCDQGEVTAYRNLITQIRDRIQYYKNQGKTLAQVLELKPTLESDHRFGATTGSWTTEQFVRAVYETLPAKGPKFSMQVQYVVPGDAKAGARGNQVF